MNRNLHSRLASALLTAAVLATLAALGACNLPQVTPTPDAAEIQTEVAALLTSMPAETQPAQPTATSVTQTETHEAASPTPTATATPTPVPGDPRDALGAPTWSDRFDAGKHFGEFEDEHVKVERRGGHLFLTAINADGWYSWTLGPSTLKDFYLEMTAKPGDCSGLDRYGLLARAPDATQGYFFGFSCDGQYQLRKWDGSQFTNLTPWTQTDAIRAGASQTNRIGLMARGSQLSLYANGTLLAQVDDSTWAEGTFGLFIAAANTAGFTVEVDEVAYWKLP